MSPGRRASRDRGQGASGSTTVCGQRRDVAQPKIEALSGERMNEMGGVADQREARADEAARDAKAAAGTRAAANRA